MAAREKDTARTVLEGALRGFASPVPLLVRINAADTPHFEADISVVAGLKTAGVVLPKAEMTVGLEALRARLDPGAAILALVETPQGLSEARALARSADRLAFGSIDFAGALGAAHRREALLAARSELVLAARLGSAPAPLDGVTTRFDTEAPVEDDAAYAASLGFGGKLLIHPAQIAPAIRGFAPDPAAVQTAERLLAEAGDNAGRFEGGMVDLPVLVAARRQLEASRRAEARLAELQRRNA